MDESQTFFQENIAVLKIGRNIQIVRWCETGHKPVAFSFAEHAVDLWINAISPSALFPFEVRIVARDVILRLKHRTFDSHQFLQKTNIVVTQFHGHAHHFFDFVGVCRL